MREPKVGRLLDYLQQTRLVNSHPERFSSDLKGDGEVDEQFWAQAAADQANALGDDADGMGDDGFDGRAPHALGHRGHGLTACLPSFIADSPAPFSTQFFQDDDDQGGGFDGGIDPDASIGSIPPLEGLVGTEEENLWAGTQDLKRTRPDYVKYTKRAKRVDVKKLKDSIWKGLEIFAPPIEGEEDDDEVCSNWLSSPRPPAPPPPLLPPPVPPDRRADQAFPCSASR